MVLLSPEEKIFIVHGAELNLRSDGRRRVQYRPIELETGVIPTGAGSCRVILGKTDVIASIKASIFTPTKDRPLEGKLEVSVRFSPVASPEFEGKKGEVLSDQVSTIVNRLYSSVPLDYLCIVPNVKAWVLCVEVSVLSLGGNLYDAISFAIKAALATSSLPKIIVNNDDKGEWEYQLSDDNSDFVTPDISEFPIFVTVSKIGDSVIFDATSEEEQCCSFSTIFALARNGRVLATIKIGPGSVQPTTFISLASEAHGVGVLLNNRFEEVIQLDKNTKKDVLGFLN